MGTPRLHPAVLQRQQRRRSDGNGQVDPGSVGSPATAKNVITVGASENDRRANWACDPSLAYTRLCGTRWAEHDLHLWQRLARLGFRSIRCETTRAPGTPSRWRRSAAAGPTDDGRIKPDVVAPGTWTLSGYSNMFQQQYDGAPNPQNGAYQYRRVGFPARRRLQVHGRHVDVDSARRRRRRGGAGLLSEEPRAPGQRGAGEGDAHQLGRRSARREQRRGPRQRAIPIPNMHEGWGRVDLANATDDSAAVCWTKTATLSTGDTATLHFTVSAAGRPFKVTLAWTDYPSTDIGRRESRQRSGPRGRSRRTARSTWATCSQAAGRRLAECRTA